MRILDIIISQSNKRVLPAFKVVLAYLEQKAKEEALENLAGMISIQVEKVKMVLMVDQANKDIKVLQDQEDMQVREVQWAKWAVRVVKVNHQKDQEEIQA